MIISFLDLDFTLVDFLSFFPAFAGAELRGGGKMSKDQIKLTDTLKWLLLALVIVALGSYVYNYYQNVIWELEITTPSGTTLIRKTTPKASPTVSPISSAETAGWQTYENTEYGFSFKYPRDWEVNYDGSSRSTVNFRPQSMKEDNIGTVMVYFGITGAFINQQKKLISDNPNREFVSEGYVQKFGTETYEIKSRNKTTGLVVAVNIVVGSDNTYILYGESNGSQPYEIIANQILSTFQFTD